MSGPRIESKILSLTIQAQALIDEATALGGYLDGQVPR